MHDEFKQELKHQKEEMDKLQSEDADAPAAANGEDEAKRNDL